jgi:hypothetical protein
MNQLEVNYELNASELKFISSKLTKSELKLN